MHAKLFAQWLQGTRCNSESSAWPILQFLYMGAAPEERDFPWLIELVFWCLLHTFVHLGSMRDRPMLFCILMILRNTTFSWIRLGELPLPSGKLGCLRGTETPCKKRGMGEGMAETFAALLCLSLSLSLSLSPTPYQDETRNTEMRESASNSSHGWMICQVPDARCHFSAGSWTCSSSPLSWSSCEN